MWCDEEVVIMGRRGGKIDVVIGWGEMVNRNVLLPTVRSSRNVEEMIDSSPSTQSNYVEADRFSLSLLPAGIDQLLFQELSIRREERRERRIVSQLTMEIRS